MNNLNKLLEGKPEANKSLEEVIKSSTAACSTTLRRSGTTRSSEQHEAERRRQADRRARVGDRSRLRLFDKFKEEFTAAATTQFGSGWAWLVLGAGS